LVLAGVAVVLFQFLRSASLYFCNADEVGVKSSCTEGKRFRLQGDVDGLDESLRDSGILTFGLTFNGATVPVRYEGGEPSDLFQPGRAAVVEGRLEDGTFAADRILVKHDSEYKAENPDRVPGNEP
jgi:cytochrome c-type biogenesis protein CcmE